MRIMVTNNKGGQGKTFFSVLMYQYLKEQRKPVFACDLDRKQLNFTEKLKQWDPEINVIPMWEITSPDDLCIIDTAPFDVNMDSEVQIIREAERVIVPIEVDRDSAKGLERVAEIRGNKDTKYVATRWDRANPKQQAEPFKDLVNKGYEFEARVGRYRSVAYNLECGQIWHKSVSNEVVESFNRLLKKLTD